MRRMVNFELPPRPVLVPRGFEPAFLDTGTMAIYRSRYLDGSPAPQHVLEGLPDAVVWSRAPDGRAVVAKPTLVAGYVRAGFFYTTSAVRRAVRDWGTF
jgi:hypothetical protein